MRSGWHWGWIPVSVTALAVACSGSSDGTPNGKTGGGPASGGTSGTAGNTGLGGTMVATGGSSVGGSSAGETSPTTGGAAGSGEEAGSLGVGGQKECASTTQEAKLTPANLLFVIDKSGSMNCNPPEGDAELNARCAERPIKEDASKPSKWDVASSALATALDTLAGQANIHAGLTVFPVSNECGVEADPVVGIDKLDAPQRTAIADALGDVSPSGETPIAGATILSYQHLSNLIKAGSLVGNTFVVLLTDGAETCRQSALAELISTDVPNARLFNIRTFVIGAPGSEQARSLLSRIAWEGGTASSTKCDHESDEPDVGDCHFDMTTSEDFAADLNSALEAISRTKVLACEFDLPSAEEGTVDLRKVNVTFKPGDGKTETIGFDDEAASCDEADGWQYSADRTKILLCGEVCDRVQADPQGEVRIALGCPTVRIVR